MANRSLGVLTLDLIARIGGFEQGMDRAARTADRRMRDIEARANAMGRAIGGSLRSFAKEVLAFTGISFSVKAAFDAVKGAIDIADETRDLSIRLGESTETISAFRYAAQQTGTDMDTLAKGMKILAKNAADALNPTSEQAKIFDALGIKVTDASGNLKQLGELIPEIADKFKGLEDGTTKAALAQALFGKSGLDLTEFLNQGADGLQTMTDRARELGVIIDSKTAAAADDFNDRLSDLKAATTGLATQVASQLLPQLNELVEWAVDFVKDGKNSAEIAHDIADGFRDMASVANDLKDLIGFLGQLRDIMAQLENMGHPPGVKRDNPFANFLKETFPGLYKPLIGGHPDFSNVTGGGPDFSNVTGNASTLSSDGPDPRKLAIALSNPTASKGAHKTGKSDAQREAEQLQAAYDRMNQSLAEQIALFGQDGEAAKVRYETEHGELSKLTKAQKDQLIQQAEVLDQKREEAEVQRQLDEINKRREEATQQVLQDIRDEDALLGATNEQLDTYNKLKYAGVDANSAWGQSIIAANKQLHEHAKEMAVSIQIQDEWRSGLTDAITDAVTGAKSLKDAFKDFFDSFAQMVTQMIAKRWVEQLFGETGSNGGGSAGGWFSSLLGSLFGGGRASGGYVGSDTLYRVNENGPELLSVGGRDFLMMGSQAGSVTPNHKLAAAGGATVYQTINVTGRVDSRTAQQMQQEAAVKQSRSLNRNR